MIKLVSEQMVMDYIDALNKEKYDDARKMLSDDFQFNGVLGRRDGGDVYIEDMKKMKFKYSVRMVFMNGDDICVLFDLTQGGKTVETFGWYHLEEGKIKSLKAIFDPRPMLEGVHKN